MQLAQTGDQVVIDITIRNNDGVTVVEGQRTVTIGTGEVFQAIENEVTGMSEGAEKSFSLTSAQAFGPRRDDLVGRLPRNELSKSINPEVGQELMAKNGAGQSVRLLITNVDDEFVFVDGNHPLAGLDLQIAVKLLKINSASDGA